MLTDSLSYGNAVLVIVVQYCNRSSLQVKAVEYGTTFTFFTHNVQLMYYDLCDMYTNTSDAQLHHLYYYTYRRGHSTLIVH